jgi:NAD+ synthetase
MNVYNQRLALNLHPELAEALEAYRKSRRFDAPNFVRDKASVLNAYFREHQLSGAVIGVSGGVDSAIVLGLVHFARSLERSPIQRILAVSLPVFSRDAATNQECATDRARLVCTHFGVQPLAVDLSAAFLSLKKEVSQAVGIDGTGWADGQLVSYSRTPALYYLTSLLTREACPAVVVGTTNQDEGAYLGFFGKASDGMVDIQLISDLHKSEVYQVARYLRVPEVVVQATPTGDMFDGRTDEQVFGTPYDFVELYLGFLRRDITMALSAESQRQFDSYATNLENLHRHNAHKYNVGSPAVHLDLYPGRVPGGWEHPLVAPEKKSRIVNLVELDIRLQGTPKTTAGILHRYDGGGVVTRISELLTPQECEMVLRELESKPWVAADYHGRRSEAGRGSLRLTCFNDGFADALSARIRQFVSPHGDDGFCTFCGVNPLFRFIRYRNDGHLVPHYDESHYFHGDKKTVHSLIIYLDSNDSGATRGVRETRPNDFSDMESHSQDILWKSAAIQGAALMFPHRILHDGDFVTGEKTIIRTDVVFERIGHGK